MKKSMISIFIFSVLFSLNIISADVVASSNAAKDVVAAEPARTARGVLAASVPKSKNVRRKRRMYRKSRRAKTKAEAALEIAFNEKNFIAERKKLCAELVEKAIRHFKRNDVSDSLRKFSHTKDFIEGEVYLFVYDYNGICLAHGDQEELIWKNLYDYKDSFGNYVIRAIIDKAKNGGGWIRYNWKNATKVSYVKDVQKGGKRFVIGAGFYPMSKKDAVVNLVRSAVDYFNAIKKRGDPLSVAFGEFNYSLGRYVRGDLYIYSLRFDGEIVAQGDRPGLTGKNALGHKDPTGKLVNVQIINRLKESGGKGIWVEYVSKRARKVAYAEMVTDSKGKNYFIACGYYPEVDRKDVIDLVNRGYTYLQKHGLSLGANEFSDKKRNDYRYGPLSLFVYDMNGKSRAHGEDPDSVGKIMIDEKDEDGRHYVREFIDKAKRGGGWVDYKKGNSFRFVYVEDIKVGAEKFVIGCGLFPAGKPETMQLLVKGAASYLSDVQKEVAFGGFMEAAGGFVKGDLSLFVFDFKGICYIFGNDSTLIWKNLFHWKDDDKRPFVKLFINAAKDGEGKVVYRMNGRYLTSYVKRVDKGGRSFVVGSSFYV